MAARGRPRTTDTRRVLHRLVKSSALRFFTKRCKSFSLGVIIDMIKVNLSNAKIPCYDINYWEGYGRSYRAKHRCCTP